MKNPEPLWGPSLRESIRAANTSNVSYEVGKLGELTKTYDESTDLSESPPAFRRLQQTFV